MFTSQEPPVSGTRLAERRLSRESTPLIDPIYVAGALWRGRYWMILLAMMGAAAGVLVALATPKIYQASTQLILDPRGLNLVQNEVTQTPLGLASDAALALIQSQIAVVTSTSVIGAVVDAAELTQDPEFNGTAEGRFDRYLPSVALLGLSSEEPPAVDRRLLTIVNLRERVSATRNANSFVIDVAVESESPDKAARLANLVASTFIAEQGRAQSDTARQATAALSERLIELRQRVGEAEEAVERYRAENQLVGVGGRLIDDEFILSTNERLAEVRSEITGLTVRANSMRETSVDDVVEGAFPEEFSSPTLVALRQTFSEVAQENAVLAARLGPRHPQRIAAEESLGTARRAIATELQRIVASAQTELARAQETERGLTSQIEELRGRQIETSGSFVELRELEREVDASRAIYEAYLLRSREIGEQESLNTANLRTISEASPPFQASGPSRPLTVMAGGVGGFALGFALVAFLALLRLFRLRLADADQSLSTAPSRRFDTPVWTALPPPERSGVADRTDPPAPPRHPEGGRPAAEPMRPATVASGETAAAPSGADALTGSEAPSSIAPAPASLAAIEEQRTGPQVPARPDAGIEPPATVAERSPTANPDAADAASEARPELGSPPSEAASPVDRGPPIATSSESARTLPADSVSPAPAALDDAAGRRDKLRERIRDIGRRRDAGSATADTSQASQAIQRLARGGRPTIRELRRRRAEADPNKPVG